MSRIPGPSSDATTRRPLRSGSTIAVITISPRPTWLTMLRAISETAVAMRVASVGENPRSSASARASARAGTMSASDAIGTRASSPILGSLRREAGERVEALVEIEGGHEGMEIEIEVDHRDRHVGLDPDDHGGRAPQARGRGEGAERSRDEGVDDVQRADVDDQPATAEATDLLGELLAKREHLRVGEVRLDGGDQVIALAEDGDSHGRAFGSACHLRDVLRLGRAVPEEALGLLQAALEVADGPHHREVDPEVHQRLGDLR